MNMNTKSDAITILCYGDSNTWGQKPDKTGRYPANVRWTGILQKDLGDDYYVIEEGLSSRTTDLEYTRKPGRNGKTYLPPCIASHNPLDIVILMLGTNDLKIEFDRSPSQIASAVSGLVGDVKNHAWNKQKSIPQIIVVSPILVDAEATSFKTTYPESYDEESALKSQQLAKELSAITKSNDCHFLDAASVSHAGQDGIHFDEASHPALGMLIADYIGRMKF
jgi:lysophospholipase L1-like esterase